VPESTGPQLLRHPGLPASVIALLWSTIAHREDIHVEEQELFAKFWVDESQRTRRVLARIPEGGTWVPDPRSRTAQAIAWQIVIEERLILDALETGVMAFTPVPMPPTMAEVLSAYDAQAELAGGRLAVLPPERWSGEIAMGGRGRGASAMAWSFLFDLIHHRGQITTYLRPMGAKVPQVYGPSGDEP
jgi:DinB family